MNKIIREKEMQYFNIFIIKKYFDANKFSLDIRNPAISSMKHHLMTEISLRKI
jgi:hypothetical protein